MESTLYGECRLHCVLYELLGQLSVQTRVCSLNLLVRQFALFLPLLLPLLLAVFLAASLGLLLLWGPLVILASLPARVLVILKKARILTSGDELMFL